MPPHAHPTPHPPPSPTPHPPPPGDLLSRVSMSSILQGAMKATKQAACALAVQGSSLAAWDPSAQLVRAWWRDGWGVVIKKQASGRRVASLRLTLGVQSLIEWATLQTTTVQSQAGVPSWALALLSDGMGMASEMGVPGLSALDIFARIPVNPDPYFFVGAVPCASGAHPFGIGRAGTGSP